MTAAAALDRDITPYRALLDGVLAGRMLDPRRSHLVDSAARVWSRPGFDTLISVPSLAFTPFDYQLRTASTVLRRMRGRAILADEVGLGKTIEAALVLSELRIRGQARRALVVTPAGLVDQWREELGRKFGLATTIAGGRGWSAAESAQPADVVLASLATARRDPVKSALLAAPWDLVIMDEAHRLRNPRSASGRLARELTAKYLLLLTATPVENRLSDLYELISMVSPGLLGTPAEFRRRYADPHSELTPRNAVELRRKITEVTVRHRRSEVALRLPHRLAETLLVTPAAAESTLYAGIAARVKLEAKDSAVARRLSLRSVTRLAGSSPMAAAPALEKLGWTDLAAQARAITRPAKVDALLGLLRPQLAAGEKVLVFSAFRRTVDALAAALGEDGISFTTYHGSLSRSEKESAIRRFSDDIPVLLSTESAGEGRNLQFCHVMINVDLPWNPMQIEQRVGRLHRVGQQHDVLLRNLVAAGTVEQRILSVLEAKINLFELVVGELDMVLGRVQDDFDFETSVFDAFVQSADDHDFQLRLASIGDRLAAARSDYLESRANVDALVEADAADDDPAGSPA